MRRQFVALKVWIQRAMSYMTVISAGSLLFLVADRFKEYGLQVPILYLAPILFLLSLTFCLLLGWFDLASGVYAEELKYGSTNNPTLMEILERVKKVELEIDNFKVARKD